MLIDGRFEVAAAPAEVLAHLFDARLMASCVPGCESLEKISDNEFELAIRSKIGPVSARFKGVMKLQIAKILEHGA